MLKRFTLTLILVLLASGGTSPAADAGSLRVKVRWVDDGDTIVVAGGERVRYLGINTPEVAHKDEPGEPFGDEAKAFNKKLVQGRWINLELAEQQRDPYGRLLAYVFLADGTFVNGELVRQGYAHLLRKQPKLRYWERLLALQRQALKKKKGMWSLPVVAGSSIGLTASLAERQPLVIDLDSEIVMKRCTMGSALAVTVNPNMTGQCSALKSEIRNPKHETNTKSEFSNVQNVTSRKVLFGVLVIWI
jgi:endonuclease YncB( thermonuclease family)